MSKIQVSVFRELTEDKLQDAINNYLDCICDQDGNQSSVIDIKYSHTFTEGGEYSSGGDVFTAMVIYRAEEGDQ